MIAMCQGKVDAGTKMVHDDDIRGWLKEVWIPYGIFLESIAS